VTHGERMQLVVLLALVLSPSAPVWAQSPPANSPAASMMAASVGTAELAPAPSTQAALLLTGRVLLENGSPPPHPAKIERVCNSVAHSEGFTDTQGNFGIHLGTTVAVTQDADEVDRLSPSPTAPVQILPGLSSDPASSSLASDNRFLDCELRAVLAGYRSDKVPLQNLRKMENPDIGVIVLRPNDKRAASATVTAPSLAVPKDARKLFDRGQQEASAGKIERAEQDFQKAAAIYPRYAAAWCAIGKLRVASGGLDSGRPLFERAIQADPNQVDPYLQLATVALWDRKWQEVSDLSAKAVELDPVNYPQLFLYAAVAHLNLRQLDSAEQSIERAQALDLRHDFPQIERIAGLISASRKEYPAAAEHLRAYLRLAPNSPDAGNARASLAEVERLTAQVPAK